MADISHFLAKLREVVPSLGGRYYRLLLVVGPIGSGKTQLLRAFCQEQGTPYVNVNLALSAKMLHLATRERPLLVSRLLGGVLGEHPGEVVALDNLELLFEPSLRLDPLSCLQGLSRNRTIIAGWPGRMVGGALTYAEPGHPEYRRYERPDVAIFSLGQEAIEA